MEIIFRGQHLHVDDQFREHATERLAKVSRYLPMADHAIVDVRREAKGDEGRYVVQVTVSANGTFMRAEERNFDLLTAIDSASDALSAQVKRFKEKKVLRSERRVDKEDMLPPGRRGGKPAAGHGDDPRPRRQGQAVPHDADDRDRSDRADGDAEPQFLPL